MEIRCNSKNYGKYKKIYYNNISKYFVITKKNGSTECGVKLTLDDTVDVPVMMVQSDKGKLVQFSRGEKNVRSFLKYGYVRLKEKCPFKTFAKCKAEKCRFYLVKNLTGDCGFYWKTMVE